MKPRKENNPSVKTVRERDKPRKKPPRTRDQDKYYEDVHKNEPPERNERSKRFNLGNQTT